MAVNRRGFLRWSAALGVNAGAAACAAAPGAQERTDRSAGRAARSEEPEVPTSIRGLRSMTDDIVPISIEERRARIAKARRLMAENRIDAILLEGGSSLFYFTGVRWGLSERPFLAVMPKAGELVWI